MTDINLPKTNQTGTNEWADVEDNDQAIVDVVNGGLDNDNLSGTAGITDANIASPNNSVYKTLATAGALIHTDATAATYLLLNTLSTTAGSFAGGDLLRSGSNSLSLTSGGTNSQALVGGGSLIYFDNADYTVSSKTQKLRVRAQVCTNATAWSSVTATFGLYPVTFAGTADDLTLTAGTVVTSSTVAVANPSASSVNSGVTSDFDVPSDGMYCLGVVTSATLTNNAAALLSAQLQTRNT